MGGTTQLPTVCLHGYLSLRRALICSALIFHLHLILKFKSMRKTNIQEIKVKTVLRPSTVNRLPQHRIATHPDENRMGDTVVSVEKYLNEFKSEKSQSRSERSNESHGSTTQQRQVGLAY